MLWGPYHLAHPGGQVTGWDGKKKEVCNYCYREYKKYGKEAGILELSFDSEKDDTMTLITRKDKKQLEKCKGKCKRCRQTDCLIRDKLRRLEKEKRGETI